MTKATRSPKSGRGKPAGGEGNGSGSTGGPDTSPPSFRGGELSLAIVLTRALQAIERAVGDVARYLIELQTAETEHLPLTDPAGIRKAASTLRSEARRRTARATSDIKAARKRFHEELVLVAPKSQERKQALRAFEEKLEWGTQRIAEYGKATLDSIAGGTRWALTLVRKLPSRFPRFLLPQLREVWRDFQIHRIGSVPVPLQKTKFDLVLGGLRLFNFGLVHFPQFPGSTPPPKVLFPSPSVTIGGRTITALDLDGPKTGNPVLPAGGGRPAVNFNGYMKIIYVSGVAAGCRIEFRTVHTPQEYILPVGAAAWVDAAGGAGSGVPRADPPGGGPNIDLGGGMWGFSDFPNADLPAAVPVCTRLVRNELYRTWVVEICPGATTRLGYWEWSFRQILHRAAAGTVSITQPPVPPGIPAPPGGWPAAPTSGPTTWVADAAAPAAAKADYAAVGF